MRSSTRRSCTRCRQQRATCDTRIPCTRCEKFGIECQYADAFVPAKIKTGGGTVIWTGDEEGWTTLTWSSSSSKSAAGGASGSGGGSKHLVSGSEEPQAQNAEKKLKKLKANRNQNRSERNTIQELQALGGAGHGLALIQAWQPQRTSGFNFTPLSVYPITNELYNLLISNISKQTIDENKKMRRRVSDSAPQSLDGMQQKFFGANDGALAPRDNIELIAHLVDLYFTYSYCQWPTINKREFLAQLQDPQNPPNETLLYAVCALGSMYSDRNNGNGYIEKVGKNFLTCALKSLESEPSKLLRLQALLITIWYYSLSGVEEIRKEAVNQAVGLAKQLGRDKHTRDGATRMKGSKIANLVWWECYSVETWINGMRPSALELTDEQGEALELPTEFDDEEEEKVFSTAYEHVRLVRVLRRIYAVVYGSSQQTCTGLEFNNVSNALNDLFHNLPLHLRYKQPKPGAHDPSALWHIWFSVIMAFCHQPFFLVSQSGQCKHDHERICASAANRATEIAHVYLVSPQGRPHLYNVHTLSLTTNSTVHLHLSKSRDPKIAKTARINFFKSLTSLQKVARSPLPPKQLEHILRIFSSQLNLEPQQARSQKRRSRSGQLLITGDNLNSEQPVAEAEDTLDKGVKRAISQPGHPQRAYQDNHAPPPRMTEHSLMESPQSFLSHQPSKKFPLRPMQSTRTGYGSSPISQQQLPPIRETDLWRISTGQPFGSFLRPLNDLVHLTKPSYRQINGDGLSSALQSPAPSTFTASTQPLNLSPPPDSVDTSLFRSAPQTRKPMVMEPDPFIYKRL